MEEMHARMKALWDKYKAPQREKKKKLHWERRQKN